jgi:glycosyltransferase involved in cell wall biosynthesis
MRILINALAVFRGGMRTYLLNLIPHLGKLGSSHEFVLLHSAWQEAFDFDLPPNFTRLVSGPKRRSPLLRVLWEQFGVPDLVKNYDIDVAFLPTPATALFYPCPTIVDLRNANIFIPLGANKLRSRVRNRVLRLVARVAVKRAAYITFVSNYSLEAARLALPFNERKAVVIYHGVDARFGQTAPEKPGSHDWPFGARPYLLTVSTIHPHKNYPRMLEAFAVLCAEPDIGYDYVVVGPVGSPVEYRRILKKIARLGLDERVHYLGAVPYQHLPGLYQGAVLFVLPSLLESFGLPLVEAMASGVPVAASRAAAMPEICAEAAVYFDPYDVDDMTEVIRAVLSDDTQRKELVVAGRKRAGDFSWERAAGQLLDAIEAAGGGQNACT